MGLNPKLGLGFKHQNDGKKSVPNTIHGVWILYHSKGWPRGGIWKNGSVCLWNIHSMEILMSIEEILGNFNVNRENFRKF